MSIFRKNPIKAGDLVIGVKKYGWNRHGAALLERYFDEPSIVLEVVEASALVFFEQQGPIWYDLSKIERVYVTEEFKEPRGPAMAIDWIDDSDQSGNKGD
jgi:hypothetical protein